MDLSSEGFSVLTTVATVPHGMKKFEVVKAATKGL
jgi:hypothetical protein